MLIALLLASFPLALILGWLFDLTPEGLKREQDVDRTQPAYRALGRKLNATVMGVLLLAVAYFAWDKFTNVPVRTPEQSVVATVPTAPGGRVPGTRAGMEFPVKSVAVLPFATRSDQQVDAYFSEGVHDDLLTQLAKIGDLKVISRTSVMQYAHSTKPVREIAAELGVAQTMQDNHTEAEQAMLKAIAFDPGNPYYGVGLAFVYACAGRDDEAIEILGHAEERRFSAVEIALVYSKLGDNDQAFAYMDRAFAESPAGLYYIAADPGADAMRSDPRWQELLDRLTQAQR